MLYIIGYRYFASSYSFSFTTTRPSPPYAALHTVHIAQARLVLVLRGYAGIAYEYDVRLGLILAREQKLRS